MAIKIIIDSASDMTVEEANNLGIVRIALEVGFGEDTYLDGIDIDYQGFYEKLIESSELPTTSQINPARYLDYINPVLEAGDTPLIITLSSKLSGTYQSACIAAEEADGDVYVVDSLNATLGERILILRAAELIDQGLEIGTIVDMLNEEKTHIKLLALLDTLEYLKKGGRISPAVAFAGGVLNIKPVVAVVDGEVVLVGKARGSKNANNLLRELINVSNGIDFERPVDLAYSGLTDKYIKKYAEDSGDIWKSSVDDLHISVVGAVVGTHVGPGAIAVSFFEKD